MKQLNFFLLLVFAPSLVATAQVGTQHFILNGKLDGQQNGLMYLYYSVGQKRQSDSVQIVNGKFSFKGKLDDPSMAYLLLKGEKRNNLNSVGFFLEPAVMKVSVTLNHFRDAKIFGSKSQNEYALLNDRKNKVQKRWQVVMDTLSAVNKRSNFEYQELKNWVLTPYEAETREVDFEFFAKHPQSYVTAFMLRLYVSTLPLDTLQMYYNRLGKRMQQTADGKSLADEIKKLKSGSPGSMATDFSTMDINGKSITLSNLRGKYVLLDFWASWCLPCRKGNPHLRTLYSKYKDKGFEIIGISDDDRNHAAWKKAVEQDSLPWLQVLRGFDMEKLLRNEPNTNDISNKFGIHSLPTRILIDPLGKIIGRYGEEEDTMDKQLLDVFHF